METEQVFKEARRKALRFLTYRGRSVAELTAYLTDHGYGEEVTSRVLEEMARLHYLDDHKLAQELIGQRLRRGYGPVRIYRELINRGFDNQLIEQLLPTLYPQDEERSQVARWLEKKAGREGLPENKRQISRWVNFLRRRGFSEQVIAGAIKNYIDI